MTEVVRSARLSADRVYRYGLARRWDETLPVCGFVLLNPSTADEWLDDPTVRRCAGFARAWGYGGIAISNLFALRATDPRALQKHADPVGPENDLWVMAWPAMWGAQRIVYAWGAHGDLFERGDRVVDIFGSRHPIAKYVCFGFTANGQPKHPLYLARTAEVQRYRHPPCAEHAWNAGEAAPSPKNLIAPQSDANIKASSTPTERAGK